MIQPVRLASHRASRGASASPRAAVACWMPTGFVVAFSHTGRPATTAGGGPGCCVRAATTNITPPPRFAAAGQQRRRGLGRLVSRLGSGNRLSQGSPSLVRQTSAHTCRSRAPARRLTRPPPGHRHYPPDAPGSYCGCAPLVSPRTPGSAKGRFTGSVEGSAMADQIPIQAESRARAVLDRRRPVEPAHRVREDAVEAAGRDVRLDEILTRGDRRDQAAERRDRRADRRLRATVDGQARTDRDWAGRDRDAAAGDRADLVGLLRAKQGMVLVIDKAKGVLMARSGCTPHEAFSLLSTAAQQNEFTVDELAECIIADQDHR